MFYEIPMPDAFIDNVITMDSDEAKNYLDLYSQKYRMTFKDYKESVIEDFKDYMKDCEYIEDFKDPDYNYTNNDFISVMDEAMSDVTGNDNGSYWFSRELAKQAISGIIFDEDFHDVLAHSIGKNTFWAYIMKEDYEAADVVARTAIYWDSEDEIKKWLEEEIGRTLD